MTSAKHQPIVAPGLPKPGVSILPACSWTDRSSFPVTPCRCPRFQTRACVWRLIASPTCPDSPGVAVQ